MFSETTEAMIKAIAEIALANKDDTPYDITLYPDPPFNEYEDYDMSKYFWDRH